MKKKVILHIDSDAFFASCEKAVNPLLKDKPVVVGLERGVVTAACYQAKKLGVERGMRIKELKEKFPQVVICRSQYPLYRLISKKMFDILRQWTDQVEEYSIDEAFLDITGLDRLLNLPYLKIGSMIQEKIFKELDISVSIGISLSKVLAKIASKYQKPKGLTFIPHEKIDFYLKKTPIEKVWGIGPANTEEMIRLGIRTAYDLAKKSRTWVEKYFHKPQIEIWHELRGVSVLPVEREKKPPKSITRSYSFYPATNQFELVKAHLYHNLDLAFFQLRSFNLLTKRVIIFLKNNQFCYYSAEIKLDKATAYPIEIERVIDIGLKKIFREDNFYRATGVVLADFSLANYCQMTFFEKEEERKKLVSLYRSVDQIFKKYGRDKLLIGAELLVKEKEKKVGLPWPIVRIKI